MPLSWNEIRDRAVAFSAEWRHAESEDADAKSFLDAFFKVFGVDRKRVATFEKRVKKLDGKDGYIDLLWKGVLLIEHKSRGKDLNRAYKQATDYFPGIKDRDLPKYILVSDFARFRLYDLESGREYEFKLSQLKDHIKHFGFVAGYAPQVIKPQDPVNIKAAEQMGRLHDLLKVTGYGGHDLEVLLVRLVFCLFADDTGIFSKQSFRDWLESRTAEDGSDLGPQLALLFQVLNTPESARQSNLDEGVASFPYVNGKLFEEALHLAAFDAKMRTTLLDCCALNWGMVSPAIFGALFQSIMDEKARRHLGAHYTSEENILKLIKPLFLDELWSEFERVRNSKLRLFEFHKKLRSLVFLDPACGCGNFLVITYRELRLLELDVLRAVHSGAGSRFIDIHQELQLDVDQFYGIELEDFPVQIAQVALWLVDHQMNQKVSDEFGMYFARIPLKTSPHIVPGNALQIDWNDVVPVERLSYIISNPPFSGAMVMGNSQREDMAQVLAELKGYGVLDYVACWYWKAAKLIRGSETKVGFVSTNSIVQGEQVGLLWAPLMDRLGVKIHFAHRTFRWSNEAKGVAAVHCVIIAFAQTEPEKKFIFEYETVDGEPHAIQAKNINAYLVDALNVFLINRDAPICAVPGMRYGSMPRDDGNLILTEAERAELLRQTPELDQCVKLFLGAHEFINGFRRYCLWLVEASPELINRSTLLKERIKRVREFRLASKAASTRKFAGTPSLFCQIAQPQGRYVLVPRHSSETRRFVPMGFFGQENIVADSCLSVPDADLYHLGVMSSTMHNAWVRYTCGRIKSDFRYSKDIVYNNFPWPDKPSDKQLQVIEQATQRILDTRAKFPESSLATLYNPLTMPPGLTQAHEALDRAVDATYGKRTFASDAERVAFLFELYQKYTSFLPRNATPVQRQKKRT